MILMEKCCFGNVSTSNPEYTFARDLKVGSSKNDVINSFYHDKKLTDAIVDGQVVGKFLYGNTLRSQLFYQELSDQYSYGFINTYASTDTKSIIEYVYFKPPYLSTFASENDAYCQITFTFTGDTVTSITWSSFPAVEEIEETEEETETTQEF